MTMFFFKFHQSRTINRNLIFLREKGGVFRVSPSFFHSPTDSGKVFNTSWGVRDPKLYRWTSASEKKTHFSIDRSKMRITTGFTVLENPPVFNLKIAPIVGGSLQGSGGAKQPKVAGKIHVCELLLWLVLRKCRHYFFKAFGWEKLPN